MAPHDPPSLDVFDERPELTLLELCEACGLAGDDLVRMVDEGLLEPRGRAPAAWRFDARALERVRITVRLQRDLDINLAGAALALDLLEEVRGLRRRVALLERQLFGP